MTPMQRRRKGGYFPVEPGSPVPVAIALVVGVSCGDGIIDSSMDEECDDGNGDSGDGCSGGCLVEEGWIDHPVTRHVAEEYLAPLQAAAVDTLILGCTHYPLLKTVIGEVMGEGVTLIDSGEAMATEVQHLLAERRLAAVDAGTPPDHEFFVSDQPERFHSEGRRFLGERVLGSVKAVDQSDIPWYDRPALGAPAQGPH